MGEYEVIVSVHGQLYGYDGCRWTRLPEGFTWNKPSL